MKYKKEIRMLKSAYPKAKHLLNKMWREINSQSHIPSTGFCYIATEALFYMIGGLDSGYKPYFYKDLNGETHWWLKKGESILDPTDCQFDGEEIPYYLGKGCGFLNGYTKPSKRAKELIKIATMEKQ